MSRMTKRDYDYQGVDWDAVNKNIEHQEDRKYKKEERKHKKDYNWKLDETNLQAKNREVAKNLRLSKESAFVDGFRAKLYDDMIPNDSLGYYINDIGPNGTPVISDEWYANQEYNTKSGIDRYIKEYNKDLPSDSQIDINRIMPTLLNIRDDIYRDANVMRLDHLRDYYLSFDSESEGAAALSRLLVDNPNAAQYRHWFEDVLPYSQDDMQGFSDDWTDERNMYSTKKQNNPHYIQTLANQIIDDYDSAGLGHARGIKYDKNTQSLVVGSGSNTTSIKLQYDHNGRPYIDTGGSDNWSGNTVGKVYLDDKGLDDVYLATGGGGLGFNKSTLETPDNAADLIAYAVSQPGFKTALSGIYGNNRIISKEDLDDGHLNMGGKYRVVDGIMHHVID